MPDKSSRARNAHWSEEGFFAFINFETASSTPKTCGSPCLAASLTHFAYPNVDARSTMGA
jgi:hypothetical protein